MAQNSNWNSVLMTARDASRLGADVLSGYFGKIGKVQEKPDSSIVSEADQKSEDVIRKHLLEAYPQYGFHGEETGYSTSQSKTEGTWFVDPLDGTTNFVHGFPYFSTSLALEVGGEIVIAAVDAPILQLSLWASRGGGAFMNGKRLNVSSRQELSECLFATGFGYEDSYDHQIKIFQGFLGRVRGIRRAGAAVMDLCYTAAGVFDVFWEQNLKSWDMAAGSLIIEEAGGKVSDLSGQKWTTSSTGIIAGSPQIHKKVVQEILNCRQ